MLLVIATNARVYDVLRREKSLEQLLWLACDELKVDPGTEPSLYHARCDLAFGFKPGVEVRLEGLDDKPGRDIEAVLRKLCERVKSLLAESAYTTELILQIRGTASPGTCLESPPVTYTIGLDVTESQGGFDADALKDGGERQF